MDKDGMQLLYQLTFCWQKFALLFESLRENFDSCLQWWPQYRHASWGRSPNQESQKPFTSFCKQIQ